MEQYIDGNPVDYPTVSPTLLVIPYNALNVLKLIPFKNVC